MTREEQRVWDLSYCPRFSFTLSLLPHPSFLPSILTSSCLCPFSTLVPSLKHHSILPSDYRTVILLSFSQSFNPFIPQTFSLLPTSFLPYFPLFSFYFLPASLFPLSSDLSVVQTYPIFLSPPLLFLPSALVLLTQAFFFHYPFSPCVPSIFLCSCPSLSWYFSLLPSFSPSLYLSLFYSVPSFLPHFCLLRYSLAAYRHSSHSLGLKGQRQVVDKQKNISHRVKSQTFLKHLRQ